MKVFFWLNSFLVLALVARSDAWSQTPLQRQDTCELRRFSRCSALRESVDDKDDCIGAIVSDGGGVVDGDGDDSPAAAASSIPTRRHLFRSAAATLSASAFVLANGVGPASAATAAAPSYKIRKVEPDEKDIYRTAQKQSTRGRPLKVLWVGSGAFVLRTGGARSGVYKDLFRAGTEVTALDLLQPTEDDLSAARSYAADNGWALDFQRGDATKLREVFEEGSFDAVVSSLFLCQDFDPAQVCEEIHRVLKPGGRYGFYEHVDDIDRVVVGKVFGDRSVIKVESDPDMLNIVAGVVKKV